MSVPDDGVVHTRFDTYVFDMEAGYIHLCFRLFVLHTNQDEKAKSRNIEGKIQKKRKSKKIEKPKKNKRNEEIFYMRKRMKYLKNFEF
jgi:hypothetical protein